jgi:TolB-like protein/DNA-binding winged helix-turn-helix (wHTH) protein/Tfp pilus assembly protein PilF
VIRWAQVVWPVADSNIPAVHLFRFDALEFDVRALELRKAGVKIKLEGQPLRILALLIERPGELVTREDLRKQLWPGNTIVDFEHSINAAMKRLREALGDSAETPRFIETLPRRGYRFLQPMKSLDAQAIPPARVRRYGWQASLLSIGLLLIGLLAVNAFGLRDRLLGRPVAGEITSIAVLSLRNLSADPEQDYFAEGMTEALITDLGKIGTFDVISHQSVLAYRGTPKSLPEIARELKVSVVLEGTVLRSGDRIRVTANLVQAAPERHLWAETFEFDRRDILAVQREVALRVAHHVRIKLTPQQEARLGASRRVDPEAYEAYLLGRAHTFKAGQKEVWKSAKEYFEKAIEIDPRFAPAYASLAELYVRTGRGTVSRDSRGIYWDGRQQARQLAEKALELDDTLAEAHTALARAAEVEWNWPQAEREYRRAVELNPSYPLARIWYAAHLCAMERCEEASFHAKRAQHLDPVSPFVNTWVGAVHFYAGRIDEARASLQKAVELDPTSWEASQLLSRVYVIQEMYEPAIAELERARKFHPRDPELLGVLAYTHARAGQREKAFRLTGELEGMVAEGQTPCPMVWAYVALEDNDEAFAWLERCCNERRIRMRWLKLDPLLAPLRTDQRFADLVRRVGLPSAAPAIAKR